MCSSSAFKGKLNYTPPLSSLKNISSLNSGAGFHRRRFKKINQGGAQGHFEKFLSLNTHRMQRQEISIVSTKPTYLNPTI